MNGPSKPYILVVEDDAQLVTLLRYNLEKQGFIVDDADNGSKALVKTTEAPPDLLLLDWMLPGISGIELCRRLRRRSVTRRLPIIMISGRAEDLDVVRGLDAGADYFVTKPFSMEALIARIRALLRRSGAIPALRKLEFHDISLDSDAHRAQRNGRTLNLSSIEFRLLEFFLRHPMRVFSRQEVLNAVWGRDTEIEPRTIDVHIRRLRKAINGPGEVDIVRTVRAVGYALDLGAAGGGPISNLNLPAG
jgi:two-component system phosphate regulon response regulator PhoB